MSPPAGKQHGSTPQSCSSIPIGSMYGIYNNIGGILMVNVTIYTIHGSYGIDVFCPRNTEVSDHLKTRSLRSLQLPQRSPKIGQPMVGPWSAAEKRQIPGRWTLHGRRQIHETSSRCECR